MGVVSNVRVGVVLCEVIATVARASECKGIRKYFAEVTESPAGMGAVGDVYVGVRYC